MKVKLFKASEVKPFVVGEPGTSSEFWGYNPRGGTALCDAIGIMIQAMDEVVTDGHKVLVIQTDGAENSSCLFTSSKIKAMVEERQGLGWTVMYMAANLDAVSTGAALGVSAAQTISYHQASRSSEVWRATTNCVARARTGDSADYTQAEREMSSC